MRKEQTSHKNEHNTLMCFPLEPVFIRDGEGVPNFTAGSAGRPYRIIRSLRKHFSK